MDYYTVLLVDDEEEVIRVIMDKIDWKELGFNVIGYANNGAKALEMMEELQPDVVMTDIKMPYMDGMELAGRIKENYPATRIIIITGFDEFEYAKEAVHLEVEEYILKPVNSVELTKVMTRIREKIDQEISEKRNVELLQKYYMDSLPFLQADMFSALIEGKLSEEEIPRRLSDCQVSLPGPIYVCAVVYTSSSQASEGVSPVLLAASVYQQAKERLGKKWKAASFSYYDNKVFIVQMKNESEVSELTDDCDRFCKYAKRIIGAKVTIGIGRVCKSLADISQSYLNAREAVSYRAIYGASRAINIKEIAPQEMSSREVGDEKELSTVFKMIRLGTEEDIREAVERYLTRIRAKDGGLQQYNIAVMEMVGGMCRFASNNNISVDELSCDIRHLYSRLLDMEQDDMQKWCVKICLQFHEKLFSERNRSSKSLISKAQDYVQEHYAEESLSLDDICGALGISNSYFSTIFKKETGKSFVGYLTDYRMQRAAQILLETDEKSYIIAKSVGYTDPNYFSYVFKRKFGVSPSKYRTEQAKFEN